MIEPFHEVLAFSLGILSGFLPCCFVCYPGLFAYFATDDNQNYSRSRAAATCLTFSAGITLVGAVVTGGLLALGINALRALGLGNIAANYNGIPTINPFNPVHTSTLVVVNYTGWAILTAIGVIYLLGRSVSIPLPRLGMPQSVSSMKGYRGGFFYGVFMGGPGQAHCTVTILIPILFLSVATLDPVATILYFAIYTAGRIVPILVAGLMLQDIRLRFVKLVTQSAGIINRLIGIGFIIGGLVLLFWL